MENMELVNLESIYKGKKVFITGHTGFKGSWLLKILHLLGANIKGYALAPESDIDLYNLLNGANLCESVIGNLLDREKLLNEVRTFKPDFIFHLAAQPLVRLSYEIPSQTFEVNAIGTANLLDAVKSLENPCTVILITTDKVYHNNEWDYPYRENDRLGGYDPYSASKACAELIIDSYRNSFFNISDYKKHNKALAVGRAGNVIGGGDWSKDRLIPDIVRSLSNDIPVIVRSPESVRPWQHVLEPLVGYLKLGMNLSQNPAMYSEAFNFGPNLSDALSVEIMVKTAIESWGKGTYEKQLFNSQLHEAGSLKLDISKTVNKLNLNPKLNASEAVSMTINWYKAYFEKTNNIIDFTEQQIKSFNING